MRKVAIVTDSNSGITQSQANELGIHILPMPFTINDKSYFEDINLSQEEFYSMLGEGAEIFTSQPAVGDILDLWDKLLTEYEEIVHIPMSSGLSASYQTAVMLAADYDGRVAVVNNQRISVTQRQSALDALALANASKNAAQIRDILEETKFESSIYIMVDTLKYLKKGGRVTPTAAAIGTVLNLKPVLQIHGEKLDAYSKTRGIKSAKKVLLDAIKKDLDALLGDNLNKDSVYLEIAHTNNYDAANEFAEEIRALYPGYDIHVDPLSLSVSCHIGPGSLAFAFTKKLDEKYFK